MATAPERLITAEEFFCMPDDGKRYELVEGRLVEVAGASWLASTVAMNIGFLLLSFVRPRKLGKVSGSDLGTRLASNPDTVRLPDVSFISAERLRGGKAPRGFVSGAADIVVEVLSPTDRYRKTARKVREYLQAGARLVWVIDPEDRSAVVHRADSTSEEYEADGVLSGDDVIPGFTLNLADIWVEAEEA